MRLTEAKEQRVDRHSVDVEEYGADEVGGHAEDDGRDVVVVQPLALRHVVQEGPLQQVEHGEPNAH